MNHGGCLGIQGDIPEYEQSVYLSCYSKCHILKSGGLLCGLVVLKAFLHDTMSKPFKYSPSFSDAYYSAKFSVSLYLQLHYIESTTVERLTDSTASAFWCSSSLQSFAVYRLFPLFSQARPTSAKKGRVW